MTPDDLETLHAALITRPGFEGVARDALEPMPEKGLAHDHIVIKGTGALLRVPRQSQFGLPARENLEYQLAGFARGAAGGHAPRLHGAIEPSPTVRRLPCSDAPAAAARSQPPRAAGLA